MSRIQQLLNIFELAVDAPEWDATADSNFQSIQEFIYTWEMTESENQITIQLQDSKGDDVEETCYLRVRLCSGTGYSAHGDASFSVSTGTIVETISSGVDEIIQSDSTGTIVLDMETATTTAVPETTTTGTATPAPTTTVTPEPVSGIIRIGQPPISSRLADYSNTLTVS